MVKRSATISPPALIILAEILEGPLDFFNFSCLMALTISLLFMIGAVAVIGGGDKVCVLLFFFQVRFGITDSILLGTNNIIKFF